MQKTFSSQLGRHLEAYVDDLVVKSSTKYDHLKDLTATFENVNKHGIKLNPEKCTFGVNSGKLLGFLVCSRGIEVNPEKIRAIEQLQSPSTVKEVQALTGRMAALSRFISRSGEHDLPFFKAIRKSNKKFQWSEEADKAFECFISFFGPLKFFITLADHLKER